MENHREKMESLRKEVFERLQSNEEQSNFFKSSTSIEDTDQAQEREASKMVNKMIIRDTKKLEDITKAIQMIDSGKYGECQNCGCEIGQKRLLAVPLAINCMECQEDLCG